MEKRKVSKEIIDMLKSDIPGGSARLDEDEEDSPIEEQMNRSAIPPRTMDLLSPEKSPVKGRGKPAHTGKITPMDIHNSWYVEAEQPLEWEFSEQELPNFPSETNSLRVLVVTWNLHGKKPKQGLDELFNRERVKHHIISVGTEECLRSIPASTFYESKSYWVNFLRKHLDSDYVMIKSHSMNALHLTLFVHKSILPNVKAIESAEVKTGIANIVGNKGGIGITFKVFETSLLFINCHLASGQKQIKMRTDNFEKIMKELDLPKARVALEKKMKQRSHILDRFDFVFWSGDFNYRVNQTRENTIKFLKEKKFESLLLEDQMTIEKERKTTFADFQEGEIKFAPTYKYANNSQLFDSKKNRTPSWTDRILFCCKKDPSKITQLNYQSHQDILISDHRPVFSQFTLNVDAPTEKSDEDIKHVKVKTSHCNIF